MLRLLFLAADGELCAFPHHFSAPPPKNWVLLNSDCETVFIVLSRMLSSNSFCCIVVRCSGIMRTDSLFIDDQVGRCFYLERLDNETAGNLSVSPRTIWLLRNEERGFCVPAVFPPSAVRRSLPKLTGLTSFGSLVYACATSPITVDDCCRRERTRFCWAISGDELRDDRGDTKWRI